jgi:hypothetical protein
MHFRRVKQLGSGDVGLVDLVLLQVRWCGRRARASPCTMPYDNPDLIIV